jgi:hypothetical protein
VGNVFVADQKGDVMTTFWTTRDGRNVRISEMTDDHLRNTIQMLERQAENGAQSFDYDYNDHTDDYFPHPALPALREEARFRKLSVPRR